MSVSNDRKEIYIVPESSEIQLLIEQKRIKSQQQIGNDRIPFLLSMLQLSET